MVQEYVTESAAEEAAGMCPAEVVTGLVIAVGLDRRVADRAVLGGVAVHPAVLDRAVDPGVHRPATLEQAGVEVAAPRSRPRALVVVRPAPDACGQRCRRCDELPPLGRTLGR